MAGFVAVMSACYLCHEPFSYHPNKVPSVRVNGKREPICETCIRMVNEARVARGLEPFPILPGAYEGGPEEEINWEDHD